MTFSQIAKNDIIQKPLDSDCALAELSAIIHTAGSLVITHQGISVEIISENENLSARIESILITFYGVNTMTVKNILIGKHVFKTVIPETVAKLVLKDCGITEYDLHGNINLIKGIDNYIVNFRDGLYAYIRGAFLGCGYIVQGKGYRMEFVFNNEALLKDFQKLLRRIHIISKNILRKSKYVLYLSSSEMICNLLAGIGADKAVLEIYSERANRSVRNTANRTTNCINANIDKAVDAAVRQINAIFEIEKIKGLSVLSPKLMEVAIARKEDPSATLQEIADKLKLSKSGINHRVSKIMGIYKEIMEGKEC